MIQLLASTIALMSCSLIFNTVKVEIPKGYEGWCYVIPVKDTIGFNFDVSFTGVYKINGDGVVYVPENLIAPKKDLKVEVYEDDVDITDAAKYMGRIATSNTTDHKKYSYVRFLVPKEKEKSIEASDAYWRENNFREHGTLKFDTLLKSNKIFFK